MGLTQRILSPSRKPFRHTYIIKLSSKASHLLHTRLWFNLLKAITHVFISPYCLRLYILEYRQFYFISPYRIRTCVCENQNLMPYRLAKELYLCIIFFYTIHKTTYNLGKQEKSVSSTFLLI